MSARRVPGQVSRDFATLRSRLTGRDLAIIDLLARHRVLTAEMLARVCFTSGWAARIRVVTLTEMEILARFRDSHRSAYRYTLGYWGAAVHAWRHGHTPPTRKAVEADAYRLSVSGKRGHLEGVNDFFTRLYAAARQHGHATVEQWLCEEEAAGLFLGKVRPDGAGLVTIDVHGRVPFFYEYDTGTETLDILAAKLDRYKAKPPDGGHRSVLFGLTRSGREDNLHHRLARERYPFPVATAMADAAALQPVWRLLGHADRVGLAELTAWVRS